MYPFAADEDMSTCSTREPEMEPEVQSDSAYSITTGTNSKMSKSHPEHQRGPKRVKRRYARVKKDREAKGLPWTEPEQMRKKAAQKLCRPALRREEFR